MFKIITFIIAIIALSISLIGYNSTLNVITENMITIIGICTTLIVGLNIYNAISVKEIEKKQTFLDLKIKKIEEFSYQNLVSTKLAYGLSVLYIQPYTAFCFFFKALEISIEHKDAEYIEKSFSLMEQMPQIIRFLNNQKTEYSHKNKEYISQSLITEISNNQLFNLYENRIENIISKLNLNKQ